LKDPKYKRIQRLFRTFPLDFSIVARFIVSRLPDGQHLLTLDRTNWKLGQTNINILVLGDRLARCDDLRVIDPMR